MLLGQSGAAQIHTTTDQVLLAWDLADSIRSFRLAYRSGVAGANLHFTSSSQVFISFTGWSIYSGMKPLRRPLKKRHDVRHGPRPIRIHLDPQLF